MGSRIWSMHSAILVTLDNLKPDFTSTPSFDDEYLRNGTRQRQLQRNINRNLYTPYVNSIIF